LFIIIKPELKILLIDCGVIKMTQIELSLSGLTCSGCTNSVNSLLNNKSGVKVVSIGLTKAILDIENSSKDFIQEIITELSDIGFQAILV